MKPSDVYFIRGQGGRATSYGIDTLAAEVVSWNISGSRVRTYDWGEWQQVVADVNGRTSVNATRLAVVYSMGANALTWALAGVDYQGIHANGIRNIAWDHATFLDPTWASIITPLGARHIKALRHYKNGGGLTPFGHGTLTFTPPRPDVEVVDVYMDHLWIQFDSGIRAWTLDNLRRRMTS